MGKEMGAKVIVDASGDPLKRALQEGVFLIKPNLREFRDLTGEDPKKELQIRTEAQRLVQAGRCEVLVISLGAALCWYRRT
jgi:6-phosphofructokinase 2